MSETFPKNTEPQGKRRKENINDTGSFIHSLLFFHFIPRVASLRKVVLYGCTYALVINDLSNHGNLACVRATP